MTYKRTRQKLRPGDLATLNEALETWRRLGSAQQADFLRGLLKAALTSSGRDTVRTWLNEQVTGINDLEAALAQISAQDLATALDALSHRR